MGYWLDRLGIPVAEPGEVVPFGEPDPTSENPEVNWLYSAQQVAALVNHNMGRVGRLADRPEPGPDAPMLWFSTDGGENDPVPKWYLNRGDSWGVAGESTDASTLDGRDPSRYVQTDRSPRSISVFHEYSAGGGVRFGDDADSAIEFSYDQQNNELDVTDTLNAKTLLRLFARDVESILEIGPGGGPNILRFGNDDPDWLAWVYRVGPDLLNIEDETENSLWSIGRDGAVTSAGGLDADGPISAEGGMTPGGDVEFESNEATGMVIEQRTNDPDDPRRGRIWYRTDL